MLSIYIYDKITKEFLYESYADIINNKLIMPECSTTSAPLYKKDGFAVVFKDTWKYEEDHRKHLNEKTGIFEGGTPYWLPEDNYLSEPRYMTEIGPLPKDAILTKPKKPQYIIDEEELEQIKQLRETECFSVVDRSQLWYKYNVNTPEREKELDDWYQAWLHITDSKPYVIPDKPIWLNPEN